MAAATNLVAREPPPKQIVAIGHFDKAQVLPVLGHLIEVKPSRNETAEPPASAHRTASRFRTRSGGEHSRDGRVKSYYIKRI
jgi:hypothetical protein